MSQVKEINVEIDGETVVKKYLEITDGKKYRVRPYPEAFILVGKILDDEGNPTEENLLDSAWRGFSILADDHQLKEVKGDYKTDPALNK